MRAGSERQHEQERRSVEGKVSQRNHCGYTMRESVTNCDRVERPSVAHASACQCSSRRASELERAAYFVCALRPGKQARLMKTVNSRTVPAGALGIDRRLRQGRKPCSDPRRNPWAARAARCEAVAIDWVIGRSPKPLFQRRCQSHEAIKPKAGPLRRRGMVAQCTVRPQQAQHMHYGELCLCDRQLEKS